MSGRYHHQILEFSKVLKSQELKGMSHTLCLSVSIKKYSELKRILPLVMVERERRGTETLFGLFFVHHLAYYLLVQNL